MPIPLRRVFSILTALAACLCANSYAVESSPLETLKQSNSRIRRLTLDNGMTCLIKENHSAPVVAVQIWVGTGSVHEQEHLGAGLSHAIEHMIFKGTPTRPVGTITREINEAGGKINAYTSYERTVFHTTMPAAEWTTGLEVLADAVTRASFPEKEWNSEREVIIREMAMGKDDPRRVLNKLLWRTAYRVHPYRHPVIGYEDPFRKISRKDIAGFFKKHYVPDNIITVVVGDISAEEAESRIRQAFSDFKRRARAPVALPPEPPVICPRLARETGAYNVSRLAWAYPAVALQHSDAAALDVLAMIVGQGKSSRLVRNIKEEKQLVYSIEAWCWTPKEPGLFTITATFDPSRENAVIEAIQDQVQQWVAEPFSEEEVAKAKRMILVNELAGLQTMEGEAYSIASGEFYAGNPRFSEAYLAMIDKLTPKDISRVASQYLVPQKRTLAFLSPTQEQAKAADEPAGSSEVDTPKRIELANGIPLIVLEDHRLPFVYICAALRGGLLCETKTNSGITSLMADLFTRGTGKQSAEEIADITDRLGASLSGFSGYNSFGMQARCLAQDTDTIMDLLAQCLLAPTFPQAELEKQRAIQIAAIRQKHEQPFFLAQESLKQMLFADHPYANIPLGKVKTVKDLTREQILSHFTGNVRQDNLAVSIFGDITPAEAQHLATRFFSDVPRAETADCKPPVPTPQLPARAKQRTPKEQTILLVGFPGVTVTDPRADSLRILQTAFSGLSSDLAVEIRDKRGLVYYVGAFQQMGLEPGLFAFYAGTREKAVDEVDELIGAEIARVCAQGLREEELSRVKEQLIGRHQMQMQDTAQLAQTCALNELYDLGCDYLFTFENRIRALTSDAVRKTASSILDSTQQATALVLPEKQNPEPKENTEP